MDRRRIAGLFVTSLLSGALLVVSCCGIASAAVPEVLYEQVGTPTSGVASGTVPTEPAKSSQGADDFTLSKTSQIGGFEFFGAFSQTTTTVAVHVYADAGTVPGAELFHQEGLVYAGNPNDFTVHVSGVPPPAAGSYWVAMQLSNIGSWNEIATIRGDPAVWENPGNGYGFGCTTFKPLASCAFSPGDFAFKVLAQEPAPPVEEKPTQAFTLGKLTRKTNGAALLEASFPGAGSVTLADVRSSRKPASKAKGPTKGVPRPFVKRLSIPVAGVGVLQLPLSPTGAAKALFARHKPARTKVLVTFTPAGGAPATLSRKVALKRGARRKHHR